MMMRTAVYVIIALIVGAVIGWGVSEAADPRTDTNVEKLEGTEEGNQLNSKAANARVNANKLLREHAVLATEHLKALHDDKPTAPTTALLNTNSDQIVSLLSSTYGDEITQEFPQLWRDHITQYENYTRALKENNEQNQDSAKSQLTQISRTMGERFNAVSPKVAANDFTEMMNEHINGTLAIIDAYDGNNQEQVVARMKVGVDHASQMADFIVAAMVEEKPDAF